MALKSLQTRKKRRMMSDMNVVPYIDVMLVLVVILMVAAPFGTLRSLICQVFPRLPPHPPIPLKSWCTPTVTSRLKSKMGSGPLT